MEAWAILKEQVFDLILTDLMMPDLDGFELTLLLRKREESNGVRRCPVIAVSAGHWSQQSNRAQIYGIDAFCTKPFTQEQLHRIIADSM